MSLDKMTIAKRYSKALFDLAVEKEQLEPVYDDLQQLKQVFTEVPNLEQVLGDVRLNDEQKSAIIENLKKDASVYVKNLIQMVYDYGRISNVMDIIEQFTVLYNEYNHIAYANLSTAVKVDSDQKQRLADGFAKRIGAKKVIINSQLDPSIIGGAVLESNGLIYDGSIRSKMAKIKKMLLK
ncbi:ATP synthase F1 subunit delta [Pediococcus ethanolidurans]|uniref:ATP synthase subunit delta n=1 Tax=Pediococcus ethanolidurans TaxID=319653 RepID=A0A0R2K6F5_9LACO|nr:ATP synthase F1 subunit delta [Pediococcus ethanolidurans]KRN81812.1 F0F1 ATP synthase subunit delta [Pediococcus ethanolidurans]MBU7555781.1 F0F1 ATP synthase subunit delta [Pediococcus ethanolidurans]MBU7562608.1 F0F1 ATP synthase subunit delta [Pediococcus ethanolidurans]MCT4398996.1 F0F1 ATP synthase subunit delta [Pediococcus ethanolidurans]MCV3314515.1 ATP synthase F1 subunit delta [Pediococcus ethanolidurans]